MTDIIFAQTRFDYRNPENGFGSCRDYKVQQCLALERYTLDQCVILVGAGK